MKFVMTNFYFHELNSNIASINSVIPAISNYGRLGSLLYYPTTIDTVLDTGFYYMTTSVAGTFPSNAFRYGVLIAIRRYSNQCFQILIYNTAIAIRSYYSDGSTTDWTVIS